MDSLILVEEAQILSLRSLTGENGFAKWGGLGIMLTVEDSHIISSHDEVNRVEENHENDVERDYCLPDNIEVPIRIDTRQVVEHVDELVIDDLWVQALYVLVEAQLLFGQDIDIIPPHLHALQLLGVVTRRQVFHNLVVVFCEEVFFLHAHFDLIEE